MREKIDTHATRIAHVSRREGLKLSAASILASLASVSVLAATQSAAQQEATVGSDQVDAIRPFSVNFSDSALNTMRQRIVASRGLAGRPGRLAA